MHQFALTPAIRKAWERDIPPEQALIEWARQLQDPKKVSIDIGAHVGDWTVDMAQYSRRVYAFEAQASTYDLLRQNCDRYPNVTCVHVALGERRGDIDLRVISEDGGGSSTVATPMHAAPARVENVRMESLDAYGLSEVSLIKIDVEGAELSVLKGARGTLESSGWPKVLFEAWSYDWFAERKAALFAHLRYLGYRIVPTTWPDTFIAER